jgi:hypothetical protein
MRREPTKAHVGDWHAQSYPNSLFYRKGNRKGRFVKPYRECEYCGSIHPSDLVDLFWKHDTLKIGGSDWKYGWPHKFYIDGIPNPVAGKKRVYMTTWKDGKKTTEKAPAPAFTHAKLYSAHLIDASDAELAAINNMLLTVEYYPPVRFARQGPNVFWRKVERPDSLSDA